MIFRFMEIFEFDLKNKEKIRRYYNVPGRDEFKATIIIPKNFSKILESFTE